jgi:hypothetical protein
MQRQTIGQKLSPILKEISEALWEFDAQGLGSPRFNDEDLASATKIFMSVVFDMMWKLKTKEDLDLETSGAMAEKLGHELRHLIKVYTGLDSHDFYK